MSGKPKEVGCKCEHWQVCPRCYPQGKFDAGGKLVVDNSAEALRLSNVPFSGRGVTWQYDVVSELRRLYAENQRLRAVLYEIAEHDHDLKCPNRPYEWVAMLRGFAHATLAKEMK